MQFLHFPLALKGSQLKHHIERFQAYHIPISAFSKLRILLGLSWKPIMITHYSVKQIADYFDLVWLKQYLSKQYRYSLFCRTLHKQCYALSSIFHCTPFSTSHSTLYHYLLISLHFLYIFLLKRVWRRSDQMEIFYDTLKFFVQHYNLIKSCTRYYSQNSKYFSGHSFHRYTPVSEVLWFMSTPSSVQGAVTVTAKCKSKQTKTLMATNAIMSFDKLCLITLNWLTNAWALSCCDLRWETRALPAPISILS